MRTLAPVRRSLPGRYRADVDERTLGVGELLAGLRAMLDEALPDPLWVEGEVRGLTRSRPGHVYFDLVDPDQDLKRPEAKLPAALFASDRRRVEAQLVEADAGPLTDGMHVRLHGRVSLYVARSQIQLVVRDIDPTFTVGRLEAARRQLLTRLGAEGVLEQQRSLPLPVLPRRVALITSDRSAACADALHELESSGLGWDVALLDTAVQGSGADDAIAAALAGVVGRDVEMVLLVRGGGSRSDLATFDAEVVARAVAACPVPVWTGIGHEIDRSIADEAAHRAHKTPTACAAALVAHVRRGLDRAHDAWRGIERRSTRALEAAGSELVIAVQRIERAAEHRLRAEERSLHIAATRIPEVAARRLRTAERHLDAAAVRVRAADPERMLSLGWSITTRADGGVVRSVTDAPPGTEIRSRLRDGTLAATVTAAATQVPEDIDAR